MHEGRSVDRCRERLRFGTEQRKERAVKRIGGKDESGGRDSAYRVWLEPIGGKNGRKRGGVEE